MRTEELAFFNQQLAVMLRDGIPLESALKQLSATMESGGLKTEISALEESLARGVPLADALAPRNFPELYKQTLLSGAKANDLPGMLTLLADHYSRGHALLLRLKGLMIYPAVVIVVALVVSIVLAKMLTLIITIPTAGIMSSDQAREGVWIAAAGLTWMPPIVLVAAALLLLALFYVPSLRSWARWRAPAFRESSIAQLASSMQVMLRAGATLPDTLAFAERLEAGSPAAPALAHWRARIASGQRSAPTDRQFSKVLPPLLVWFIDSAREDPAAGLEKAAEFYRTRAGYRTELLMYGALPISVLLLGTMIIWQAAPVFRTLVWFMNAIGGAGD